MLLRHRRGTRTAGRLRRTLPDYHPSDDDTEEHAINICIDLYDRATDVIVIPDHRTYADVSRYVNLDLHDPANDDTILDVLRALHDRRPALYHGGEPDDDAAACDWCAALAARRASPPGDEVAR